MRIFLAAIAIIICILYSAPSDARERLNGIVRHVADGDTISVISRGRVKLTVRLYGIDAPETRKAGQPGQRHASVARRILMYKLIGKPVNVEIVEKDKYGRIVGIVRHGGRDINAEMIEEGLAWAYRQYLEGDYASEYIALEEKARRHRVGLWRQPNPQPPWEFRRKAGKSSGSSWFF